MPSQVDLPIHRRMTVYGLGLVEIVRGCGVNIDELRRLAEAATPGPWKWESHRNYCDEYDSFLMPMNVFIPDELSDEDADYIVSVSPDVVIGLLDEINRLQNVEHVWPVRTCTKHNVTVCWQTENERTPCPVCRADDAEAKLAMVRNILDSSDFAKASVAAESRAIEAIEIIDGKRVPKSEGEAKL